MPASVPLPGRASHPLLARLLPALAVVLALQFLVGGSACYVRHDDDDSGFCDDDDFDDDDAGDDDDESCNDDDDGFVILFGTQAADYRLEEFRLRTSRRADRHPVERVELDAGPSLFRFLGPGEYDLEDLFAFSERILAGNEDLLGLGAGRRRVRLRAESTERGLLTLFGHEALDVTGAWRPLRGESTLLRYDLDGTLLAVELDASLAP